MTMKHVTATDADTLLIYADGSCKGNPGEGGAGVAITDEHGQTIAQLKRSLGAVTNNIAEYSAIILGLQEAKRLKAKNVSVFLDSELVVNQINGLYRVRDDKLKPLHERAKKLLQHFTNWKVRFVPREQNREADRLAREAVGDRWSRRTIYLSPSSLFIRLWEPES